jgi:drug/metabolite transporter (DMT)-like permease
MRRLVVLAVIWGWSFLFIKVAVGGMTPTTVAGARVALGAAVLLAVLRWQGTRLPRDPRLWGHFTVMAVTGSVLPFTLLAWGEERITSALAAVLNASTPLFTALCVAVLVGEPLRRMPALGLAIGFGGVAVAAGVGGADLAESSVTGSLAAVAAGAGYGLAFAWTKRHLMGVEPTVAAAGQLIAATILLAPLAVATSVVDGIDPAPRRLVSILLLGALGTGVAYALNYRVVHELGPTKASLVTYLVPVVAVAVGIATLGERFEPRILLGGVLIVLGVAVVSGRVRFRPRAVPSCTAVVALAMAASVLVGCGDGGGGEGACGPIRQEALDPSSLQHVLPGAEEPAYRSDPPTSGPHLPGPDVSGVVDGPIPRPEQVGILERGDVLIQHEGLDASEVAELEKLASARVVIAQGADLPAPIVATAWVHKRTCDAVDVDALAEFVNERAGKGPDQE